MIKANMPCRVSFQVRQRTDSRTILDQNGGENLLGKGDMLFLPPGVASLQRCHGPFVTDDEVRNITDFLRAQGKPEYDVEIKDSGPNAEDIDEEYDEFYDKAVDFIARQGKASTSMIQRQFKIGYNRAARIIECMEREGVVGPQDGSRPRKVLVDPID
jgi:S-DNA-T family DNA segregation ATPase FtsK/SpoIIIE